MSITAEELRDRVAQNYDVCLLCDELEISPEELLECFADRLWDKRNRFEEYLDE